MTSERRAKRRSDRSVSSFCCFSTIKGLRPCSMPLQGKMYIHINISPSGVGKPSVYVVAFFIKFIIEFALINCISPCPRNEVVVLWVCFQKLHLFFRC